MGGILSKRKIAKDSKFKSLDGRAVVEVRVVICKLSDLLRLWWYGKLLMGPYRKVISQVLKTKLKSSLRSKDILP